MAIFVLTGTPGTGKTTISKMLIKSGFNVIDLNSIVNEKHLWYKKEKGCKVVNLTKLKNEILKKLKSLKKSEKDILIEGHLACEFNIPADAVIVLRTRPDILIDRLKKRKYSDLKISENIQAEIIDYCTVNSERHYNCPIFEVDSSGTLKSTFQKVLFILKNLNSKTIKNKKINWARYVSNKKVEKYLFRY